MQTPLVNIYVPTYEPNPDFLRKALDSIKYQTEQCYTVFIHDDASKTDVHAIVKSYLEDPRFKFTRSEKRLGIGGNWNACLKYSAEGPAEDSEQSRGKRSRGAPFIQYLFQDDYWYANYLQQVLSVFEKYPHIGFISADHDYEFEKGIRTKKSYMELRTYRSDHLAPGPHEGMTMLRWWMQRELHPNVIGEPCFVMMKRSHMEKVGRFNEDMVQFLDVDYWVRLLQHANWYYLPEELGVFRVHAAGASAQNDQAGTGIFDRFRCIEQFIKSLPKGHDHEEAIAMRNRALNVMVWKFLDRIANRKKISTSGSGALSKFCLHHPILTSGAVLRALKGRPR